MIDVLREIKPKNPILIAAWPGMGQVALYAARYLKDKLKCRLFARLRGRDFFYQTDIAIRDSVIDLQDYPEGKFYYWENKAGGQDVIIFLSEMQPQAEKFVAYTKEIIDFVCALDVKMILTFAAMVTSVDYVRSPKVRLAVTHKDVVQQLFKSNVKPLKTGQISGLNGFLLGVAKEKNIPGACFLGEIPFYATQIENPRTSHAILNAVSKFLGVSLDLSELSIAARKIEEELGRLMDFVNKSAEEEDLSEYEPSPISIDDVEKIKNLLAKQKMLPHSTKKQIEELFSKAQENISSAADLKKTLDEWHVYKDYEDRFLELFKKEDTQER